MASFNKVILMGNLTRDPQVRYTPSGTAVTELGLAVNRVWFDKQSNQKKEDTTFVDVTLWGRQAEVAGEYLSKGRSVLIEGRLQLDQWDDKETGQKRSKLKVVGENMTMTGGRSDGGGGSKGGGNQQQGGFQNQSNQGFQNQPNQSPQQSSQQSPQQSSQQSPQQSSQQSPADSFYDTPAGSPPDDEVPF